MHHVNFIFQPRRLCERHKFRGFPCSLPGMGAAALMPFHNSGAYMSPGNEPTVKWQI